MFALKKKYTCLICHEDVSHPCFLNLNCDCVYECHYKCFNEWYKIKNECIICHEVTNGKPFWRKLRRRKKRKRNRTPPRRVLTTEEIERRLARLPDDNENERKTLKFIFFFMVLVWFIYNHLK